MLQTGQRLGNYEIERHLGSGGMAMVFLARHVTLGDAVAIKVLLPHYAIVPKVVERFRREAQVQHRLSHAHIVRVSDYVEDGAIVALVMEFVDGVTLDVLLAAHPSGMPWPQALTLLRPVVSALAHAHAHNVVHRDLKPANVLLDQRNGVPGVAKVADFGIAKILDSEVGLTGTNSRMGTWGYMAPEQFRGAKHIDARADVFALGMLLWETMAGRLPFDPDDQLAVMQVYAGTQRIRPLSVVADCPVWLSDAVAQALAVDPADRFLEAGALLQALKGSPVNVQVAASVEKAVAPAEDDDLDDESDDGLGDESDDDPGDESDDDLDDDVEDAVPDATVNPSAAEVQPANRLAAPLMDLDGPWTWLLVLGILVSALEVLFLLAISNTVDNLIVANDAGETIAMGRDLTTTAEAIRTFWLPIAKLSIAAAFLLWMYRAAVNVRALGDRTVPAAGWVAFGFLVPGVNLVHGVTAPTVLCTAMASVAERRWDPVARVFAWLCSVLVAAPLLLVVYTWNWESGTLGRGFNLNVLAWAVDGLVMTLAYAWMKPLMKDHATASQLHRKMRTGRVPFTGSEIDERSGYVRIASGEFWMGSPAGEKGRWDDEVRHHVRITRGYWLKATPVTQAEWRAVMGSNPSHFSNGGDSCPVEQVSWEDAVAYCNKLSKAEGLQPCYEGTRFLGLGRTGYRLPTEAEWEYAARAGTTEARYGDIESVAWYGSNSGNQTHAVRGKAPNAWGLHDMLGNVWEWTNDWKADYGGGPADDPVGPSAGQLRVNRGGSWNVGARNVRAAYRDDGEPALRDFSLGFRPARSVP